MKHNGSYLRQYLPWLGLLLGVDALAALLLWLADARAFAAAAGELARLLDCAKKIHRSAGRWLFYIVLRAQSFFFMN